MKLLLDTCALIWFVGDDTTHMPSELMSLIEDDVHEVYVSVASIWEIAIKTSLKKLKTPKGFGDDFESRLNENGLEVMAIKARHAVEVKCLPWVHRDPFDRLLISQCRSENLVAVTPEDTWRDPRYGIHVIWNE